MGVFTDIELDWGGKVFTIRGQRVMGAISRIEDVITMPELQAYSLKGTYPLAKLCAAYASMLRYAGARVSDEEVYALCFAGEREQEAVVMGVMNLMKMMLPASARAKMEAALADPDGVQAQALEESDLGNSRATARASLKKPTRPRSRKANG
jgi:hypothetical protein